MANEVCVVKLKEGVLAWNAWVNEKGSSDENLRPDLSRADLSRADLSKAELGGADLSGADLSGADLSKANLRGAILRGAILRRANLSEADLRKADLSWADLSGAHLFEADLRWAYLSRADLSEAELGGADLSWADLDDANLGDVDLTDAKGFEVDSCRVVHTRFSPYASDKWSILRRTYTGPNLVLNLLLLLLFFAPLIIEGASLSAIGGAEQRVIDAVNHIDEYHFRADCKGPDGAITGRINQGINWKERQLRIPCRTQPVWKMLLGYGRPNENVMPYLTVALIAYQIARYFMTMRISAMREAEERSGISPPRSGFLSYRRLFWVHRIMFILVGLSMVAFVYRVTELLNSDLILIGSGH